MEVIIPFGAAIVTGIFTLIAARYGFKRGEASAHARDEEARRQLVYNAVTLLRLETDHNRSMLQVVWNKVSTKLTGDVADERPFQERTRFVAELLPRGRLMFESWAARLPEVLDQDTITNIYNLYAKFDMLSLLQSAIAVQLPEGLSSTYKRWQRDNTSQVPGTPTWDGFKRSYPALLQFNEETKDLWNRAKDIMNEILTANNPVPELPTPTPTPIPAPTPPWNRLVGRR